jgi:methylmalonyl-CoA mutase
MLYEHRKHDGSLPIVGVNTFLGPDDAAGSDAGTTELSRATEEEKRSQLARLTEFWDRNRADAEETLRRLRRVAASGGNTFAVLMDAVRVCSLGQITEAFFEVGGQYRRNA